MKTAVLGNMMFFDFTNDSKYINGFAGAGLKFDSSKTDSRKKLNGGGVGSFSPLNKKMSKKNKSNKDGLK